MQDMTAIEAGPDDDLNQLLAPGRVIRLKPGRYEQPLHIAHSGVTLEAMAGARGEVEFWRVGIEVRGASDVTLRGLVFRQSDGIGIFGPAENITIDACRFEACALKGTVTVWLGEDTHRCVVRRCHFDLLGATGPQHRQVSHTHSIGIMTAEERCVDHRIEGCTIAHYDYGIQLGATGTCTAEGRHTVRDNRIICPRADGIHVKQSRCRIEGNHVVGATRVSMSARAGAETTFTANEIVDGYIGVSIRGRAHAVTHNRFQRVRAVAVLLEPAKPNGDGFAAEDTIIEGNTFTDCGGADPGAVDPTHQPVRLPPYPPNRGVVDWRDKDEN